MQFSEEGCAVSIPCGGPWRSSFTVRAADGRAVRGKLFSDSRRILLAADTFSGEECEIVFGIDTKGLQAGDTVEGTVWVSSDLGEKPFNVLAELTDTPGGDFDPSIRTLEDLEQLCRRSMREGFRLFTHPDFPRILHGKNVVYLPLYKGMSHNPVTYQHLEEFLIASGKKEPILLSLDRQQKAVYHLNTAQKDTLYIYKNNWGYVHLEIEAEGNFLEVEHRSVTSEDFIGSVYGLEYIVHPERLGPGRSFGRIVIRTVHQELVYEVEASAREGSEILPSAVRSRRTAWLMRDYLSLLTHRLDYRTWQDTSALTVGEMLEEDPADVNAVLYAAFLHYTREDYARAMEALWPIKEGKLALGTDEQKAAYACLAKRTGLLPREEMEIWPMLRRYCQQQPASYLLLYLLQQETEEGHTDPSARLQQLEDCFEAGCTSPFLYLDAWEMLKGEEALLRRLSPFMIQVLCFGQKQGMMTMGLLKRAAFLSANLKSYSGAVYRLLSRGYEQYPEDEILEAICQLLIKGEPLRRACFPWYAKAVERDLRITRLYEYYMETYDAPAKEPLPVAVRMYFATNSQSLGESKRALLYASVILHGDEDPTGYMNYTRAMRPYALEALRKGRIDRNYAVLYQHFFSRPDDPETAELMSRVLFVQRVSVADPSIRRVIVCHNALKDEDVYPCRDGVAWPRIYSEDACILFEDDRQRRFASTVTWEKEPLFQIRDTAQACMYQGVDNAGLELYICRSKAFQMDINDRSAESYRMAERNPDFTDAYRRTIRRKLLEYELSREESFGPAAVPSGRIRDYAEADRVATAQILIRGGQFEDAFYVISEYGSEKISAELLSQLAVQLIRRRGYEYDEELFCLAEEVFQAGKYEEETLRYLREHPAGPVPALCRLWEKLQDASLDAGALEETILLQSVETHQFPEHGSEILQSCIRRSGRQEVIRRYLVYLCGHDLFGGRKTEGAVFAVLEQLIGQDRLEDEVCRLALLKHYAYSGIRNEKQEELAGALMKEMNGKGLRFAFYKLLPSRFQQAYQLEDKIFIEEQFTPDSRVVLHYQLTQQGDADEAPWTDEPMKRMYEGIFSREFLLFYGETLRYQLRIMKNGTIYSTDTKEISLTEADTSGSTRYKLLNRMLKARDRGDEAGLRAAWKQYRAQEEAAARLLSPIQYD